MITILIANQKGGVGKTTIAVNLAAAFAGAGKKVVLGDMDPQGNVAKWFGMSEEAGIYDLLIKERPVEELLRLVPRYQWWPGETSGVLAILPGNSRTTTAGVAMAIDQTPPTRLRDMLAPLANGVDVIVLDTAPTVTEMHVNVMVAADYVVIPTETRILSVNGVIKTMERIHVVAQRLPIQVLGIIPNKHAARQLECQANLETLTNEYGDLIWPAVAERSVMSEAPAMGQSIFAYAPRHHKAVKEMALMSAICWKQLQIKGVQL